MRPEDARRLLDDSALFDAFQEAINQVTEIWKNSPSDDEAGREACYREIHGIKAAQARLAANLKTAANK